MLLACSAGIAGRAAAQEGVPAPRWGRDLILLPDVGGQLGIGMWLGYAFQKPADHGPWPHLGEVRGYVTWGTTGSRTATLAASAPALWKGWRVLALARTERLLRTPFFGLDNGIRQQDSLQDAYGNLFYRYALLRTTGYLTVQRRLAGPLWLMAAGQARTWRTSGLKQQPNLYSVQAAQVAGRDTLRFSGFEGRGGLLYDTRDEWIAPTRGVLLELIGAAGQLRRSDLGGPTTYARGTAGAREFIPLGREQRTVLALRQRLGLARDTLPFFLAWERVTSWLPDDGIAAGRYVRLHGGGSQLASNDALASVEVRHKLMVPQFNPEDPAALWGIAFADLAQLWEPHGGPHHTVWTLGTGVRLQMSRTNLVGLDVGWTDLGPNLALLSYFAF